MVPVPASNACSQTDTNAHEASTSELSVHFLFDANQHALSQPGVLVTISALPRSPFLEAQGARKLVSFLYSLPHRSVILVVDSIQRHTIMSSRGKNQRKLDMKEAHQLSLERGNLYMKAISRAMKEENTADDVQKVGLVRWDDVMNENKREQELILHRHFMHNKLFRDRVEQIATLFVNERMPNSRFFSERKMHAVNFLLAELGVYITGVSYQQERYQTLAYATRDKILAETEKNVGRCVFKLIKDINTHPSFANLKDELVRADEGMEATNGCPVLMVVPN